MRISTQQMQQRGVDAMLERQAQLSVTQQQLATGKRLTAPSDDVLASTQVLALNEVIATYGQYQSNADVAENRLAAEEISITQGINVLQRARELAIQGNGGSLGAANRADIAVEVREILDEIIGLANTVDANGEYLFAGFNVDTAPFTVTENPPASGLFDYAYTGDLGQRSVQIGATRQVAVGDPGQDVFMNIPVSGGGTQSVFETLEQLAVDLEANVKNFATADDLQQAIDWLGGVRARIGARQNAIDTHRILNEDIVFQGKKTLSEVQDLDYAEAISRMNLQMVGLEASQRSFSRIQNLSLFNFL